MFFRFLLSGIYPALTIVCLFVVNPLYAVPRQNDTSIVIGSSLPSEKDTIKNLQKMVVTAGRYQRLMETAQSLTIITPDEWIGTGKSLADVIAEQPGIQTRRFGGRGSFQTVSIRGVEGSDVQILLDGIPLNSAMGGAVDLGKLNPSRLSAIEIYRSFIPARYGGNSLGGVINLVSVRPERGTGGDISASIGNYRTQNHQILLSHSPGAGVNVLGCISFEHSENDYRYLDRNNTFMGTLIDPTLDDTERVMMNDQYTLGTLLLHPSIALSDELTLFTNVSMSYAKKHLPAEEGKQNVTAYYSEKTVHVNARLVNGSHHIFTVEPAIGYNYSNGYRFFTSLDEGTGASHSTLSGPNSYSKVGAVEQSGSIPVTMYYRPAPFFTLESMVQVGGADINPMVNTTGQSHGDWHCSAANGSAAVDAIGVFDPLGVIFGASVRGEYTTTKGGVDGYTLRELPESDTITCIWSLKGGTSLHLFHDALLLYCNGGRFSNAPSLRQRYGAKGAHNPNPTLIPETVYSGELGIKLKTATLFADVCGFYNRSYDKILTVFDGRQSTSINCSGARVFGVETSVIWSIRDWLQLDSRTTLQHTENLSRQNGWYGNRLPNEPGASLLETVRIGPFKGLSIWYGIKMNSFFYRNPANIEKSERVPRYEYGKENDFWGIYHNGKLQWNLFKHLTIILSAENVTNRLLTAVEMVNTVEGSNSLVLQPVNQFFATLRYSF